MQQRANELIYKEGWKIEVREGAFEGAHLIITVVVPDSTRPGETMELDVHSSIPPQVSLDSFDLYLQWRINRIETHEAREFLRLKKNGKALLFPHISDKDLYEIEAFKEYRGE